MLHGQLHLTLQVTVEGVFAHQWSCPVPLNFRNLGLDFIEFSLHFLQIEFGRMYFATPLRPVREQFIAGTDQGWVRPSLVNGLFVMTLGVGFDSWATRRG